MKRVLVLMSAWAASLILCRQGVAQDELDLKEVLKDPFTAFIVHAAWPDDRQVASGKCDTSRLGKDVDMLKANVNRLLRGSFLPSDADFKNVVGLTNYMADVDGLTDAIRSNDYIMLRYATSNRVSVMIQDGQDMYVCVTLPAPQHAFDVNLTNFIGSVATNVLNYPASVDLSTQLVVFVSTMTIGYSRLGSIYWGKNPGEFASEWYDTVRWWSDGRRILFRLTKLSHKEILLIRERYASQRGFFRPRRFCDR